MPMKINVWQVNTQDKKALDLPLEKGLYADFLEKAACLFWSPAEVAQSVEQGTENPRVGSSILSLGTITIKGLQG